MRQNETPFAYHHFFSSFFVQDSLSLSCLSINHIMNDLAVNFRQWNKLYANIVNIKYEAKKEKKRRNFINIAIGPKKKENLFSFLHIIFFCFSSSTSPPQHPKQILDTCVRMAATFTKNIRFFSLANPSHYNNWIFCCCWFSNLYIVIVVVFIISIL